MESPSDRHTGLLLQQFRSHALFNSLDENTVRTLFERVEIVALSDGEVLFSQGDRGNALFIISAGQLGIYISEKGAAPGNMVARLEAGEAVGEIAMLTGAVRNATARALQPTTLFKITRETFDHVVQQDQRSLKIITNNIKERLHKNQLFASLSRLMGDIHQEVLNTFLEHAEWVYLSPGEALWSPGDAPENFYIVVSGRLKVWLSDPAEETGSTYEVGSGGLLGEMDMITASPRSAVVRAMRNSALVRFTAEFFNQITSQHPDLLRRMTREIILRLKQSRTPRQSKRAATQLAIVPLSEKNVQFGFQLSKAIRQSGYSVLYIDRRGFNTFVHIPHAAMLPLDDPNDIRLQAWLEEQEAQFDFVIFQTQNTVTNWTRRVLQQADLILLTANADDDPSLRDTERWIQDDDQLRKDIPRSLVLMHSRPEGASSGTNRWLAGRDLENHYHLYPESAEDTARIARHLTGHAVGVVLSGGGARGFAHIGVLKALNEAQVPIDFLLGVSSGALVAGLYGVGQSYEKIAQNFLDLTKNAADITLPLVSMIRGRKMARRIHNFFGDIQIEDLRIPVYCVSSNLSNATPYLHSRGDLWQAVLASNTPVGFAPPVVIDGDLLMDGNALNNMPADILSGILDGGSVIAVDVSKASDLVEYPAYGPDGLSGWQVLGSKLNPFSKKIQLPNTLSLIMRSQELSSLAQSRQFQEQYIDYFFEPPVEDYPVLDYKKGAELVEVGYRHAIERIQTWQKSLPRKQQ